MFRVSFLISLKKNIIKPIFFSFIIFFSFSNYYLEINDNLKQVILTSNFTVNLDNEAVLNNVNLYFEGGSHLYLIDKSVSDKEFLKNKIQNNSISDNEFHLFSHGKPGFLYLNDKWRDAEQIVSYLKEEINSKAKKIEQINIYGCEFAKGYKGREAVKFIENSLGISIAASDDITGKDGDWDLEVGSTITAISLPNYQYNLQTCSGIVGGIGPNDDRDGDGYCNNVDLDDDNDGILDTDEGHSTVLGVGINVQCDNGDIKEFNPVTNVWDVVCPAIPYSGDLAISPTGEIYVCDYVSGSVTVYRVNNDCTTTQVATTTATSFGSGLAFLPDGRIVLGTNLNGIIYQVNVTTGVISTYGNIGGGNYINGDLVVQSNILYYSAQHSPSSINLWAQPLNASFNPSGSPTLVGPVSVDALGFSVDANGNILGLATGDVLENISTTTGSTGPSTVPTYGCYSFGASSIFDTGNGCLQDTDGDGICDYLDWDSDDDGCPDAIEGAEGIVFSQLSNGAITGNVDANGVPMAVSAGGQGQLVGTSADSTQQSAECDPCNTSSTLYTDSDGDNIGDLCDLDNDNDGILDADECQSAEILDLDVFDGLTATTGGVSVSSTQPLPGFSSGTNATLTLTHNGSTGNISALASGGLWDSRDPSGDGSSIQMGTMNINNTQESVVQFDFDQPVYGLSFAITDLDQNREITVIEGSNNGTIIGLTNSNITEIVAPLPVRSINHFKGVFGNAANVMQVSYDANQPIDKLVIRLSASNASNLNVSFTQTIFNLNYTARCDTDGDGTADFLDTDSDSDGCPDAIEGAGTYIFTDVDASGKITTGTVDGDGVPNGGTSQGIGTSIDVGQQSAECDPCNASSSLFTDTDNDTIGDACDLDDDNDGILDVDETCAGFIAQNTDGPWYGTTSSAVTTTIGISPQSLQYSYVINDQINFHVNNTGGDRGVFAGGNRTISYNFSPGIPANEIGFQILDVDGNGVFTLTVNGVQQSTDFAQATTDNVNWNAMTYDPAAGTFTRVTPGPQNQVGILIGTTTNLITSFSMTGTGVGGGDLVAYSLFARTLCDTDGDGIPDNLDTDSDGDGCPDAIEGDGSFMTSDLVNFGTEGASGVDNSLGDIVNENGIPTIVTGGLTTGTETVGQATTTAVTDDTDSNACKADLSLRIGVNNAIPKTGDNIIYSLKISNNGPFTATGVKVTGGLVPGLSYVSDNSLSTSTTFVGNTWNVGDIISGQTMELQITATVNGAGTFTNTAEIIQSNQTDTDSTPNNGN